MCDMIKTARDTFNSTICPSCGTPLVRVGLIWRAFQDDLEVWQCRSCGTKVRQTAKASKLPPQEPASFLAH
jgi:RNase P subunit RPR2